MAGETWEAVFASGEEAITTRSEDGVLWMGETNGGRAAWAEYISPL